MSTQRELVKRLGASKADVFAKFSSSIFLVGQPNSKIPLGPLSASRAGSLGLASAIYITSGSAYGAVPQPDKGGWTVVSATVNQDPTVFAKSITGILSDSLTYNPAAVFAAYSQQALFRCGSFVKKQSWATNLLVQGNTNISPPGAWTAKSLVVIFVQQVSSDHGAISTFGSCSDNIGNVWKVANSFAVQQTLPGNHTRWLQMWCLVCKTVVAGGVPVLTINMPSLDIGTAGGVGVEYQLS